jgi:hypothetical protein
MTSTSEQVSDLGFALLRMMHRAMQGGPRLPAGAPFTDAYRELEARGLAVNGELTLQGENLLYQRYANP